MKAESRPASKEKEKPQSKSVEAVKTTKENEKKKYAKKDKKLEENKKAAKKEPEEVPAETKPKAEESDWSLSLSGSEDWERGSPERKARPLGDPNWVPDRRERDTGDRGYRTIMSKITAAFHGDGYMGFDRGRTRLGPFRYEERAEPNLRSHVSRPSKSTDAYPMGGAKDSKKSRHKRDKKRKRKYHHEKETNSKKSKNMTGSGSD